MINENIYTKKVFSKTNQEVFLFPNGRSFFSLYDPLKEANNYLSSNNFDNKGYFCIAGCGNGYHIKLLQEKFPSAFILVIENNQKTIDYLLSNKYISTIFSSENTLITNIDSIYETIIQTYKPALHGNFSFSFVRSWLDYNIESQNFIEQQIKDSINTISNDYITQAHFGKTWMHNIFNNLKYQKNNSFSFPTNKFAAIIGAGPTLEKSLYLLKKYRDSFYIISTDTALPVLIKHNIIPECFISIDAQIYSREHFIGLNKYLTNTIHVLDYSANSSILNNFNQNSNILFFTSGHPLISYLENKNNLNLLHLDCGRGTVTSAACDFACKMNFSKIVLFGCDFGYPYNKAYSNDTYLANQYIQKSNLLNTFEFQNIQLLFRTQLIKQNSINTSKLLTEYKNNLLQYIQNSNSSFFTAIKENNCLNLPIINEKNDFVSNLTTQNTKYYQQIIPKSSILNFFDDLSDNITDKNLLNALLPFYAWCKEKNFDFLGMINLAKKYIHNYTIR